MDTSLTEELQTENEELQNSVRTLEKLLHIATHTIAVKQGEVDTLETIVEKQRDLIKDYRRAERHVDTPTGTTQEVLGGDHGPRSGSIWHGEMGVPSQAEQEAADGC